MTAKLKLPANMTEVELMGTIDKIVNILAPRFKFGYFTVDDMKQEGRRFALLALASGKYDEGRPLENFLYRHIKNRFINFKRDKFRRNDPPCKSCHNCVDGQTQHDDKQYCSKYVSWRKRNLSKQNIMNPLDIGNISDEKEPHTRTESSVLENIEFEELLAVIDQKLPVELRSTYLQMRQGDYVPKNKREEVERVVVSIMKGNVICLSEKEAQ